MKTLLIIFTLTVSVVFFTNPLCATGDGEIQGKVTDSTGTPLFNVMVQISKNGEEIEFTESNEFGLYEITNIPAGKYDIAFFLMSYQKVSVPGYQVSSDQIHFLDVMLPSKTTLLKGDYVIEAERLKPRVETGNPSFAPSMDSEKLDRLPIDNIKTALAMIPTAHASDDGEDASYGGMRQYAATTVVDDMIISGDLNLPMAAIEELKVILGGVPARYGDMTSAVIVVTTKSY